MLGMDKTNKGITIQMELNCYKVATMYIVKKVWKDIEGPIERSCGGSPRRSRRRSWRRPWISLKWLPLEKIGWLRELNDSFVFFFYFYLIEFWIAKSFPSDLVLELSTFLWRIELLVVWPEWLKGFCCLVLHKWFFFSKILYWEGRRRRALLLPPSIYYPLNVCFFSHSFYPSSAKGHWLGRPLAATENIISLRKKKEECLIFPTLSRALKREEEEEETLCCFLRWGGLGGFPEGISCV